MVAGKACLVFTLFLAHWSILAFAEVSEDLAAKAKRALEQDDFDAAIALYTTMIEQDSTASQGYYGRGTAYLFKGNGVAAIPDLSEAIRRDPQNSKAYCNRGIVHLTTGNPSAAISDLSEAIRLDPKNNRAYCNRASAYLVGKGDVKQAISDLDEAIRLDPTESTPFSVRAAIALAKGDYDKAIADASEAVRLCPINERAFLNRSSAYMAKGNFRLAIGDATRAIELSSHNAVAFGNRAKSWEEIGEIDKAITDYTEAIKLSPKSSLFLCSRGRLLVQKGLLDDALPDFDEAIRAEPNFAEGHAARGTLYAKKGDVDSAIRDYSAAIAIKPNDSSFRFRRATFYCCKNEFAKAIPDYDAAIRSRPSAPWLYEHRGAARIELGDYDGGAADIATAIRLNPADPARKFEAWVKYPLNDKLLDHGRTQVKEMLHDRPAMERHGEKAEPLYQWAARKFAGEDLSRPLFWSASSKDGNSAGYVLSSPPPTVGVQEDNSISVRSDEKKEEFFDLFWSMAANHLYLVADEHNRSQLYLSVVRRRISKEDFIKAEFESVDRSKENTRAFYIQVVLPWAKENRVPTHPRCWFIANSVGDEGSKTIARDSKEYRNFAYVFDLLLADGMLLKGEYGQAVDIARKACKTKETMPSLAAFDELVHRKPPSAEARVLRALIYVSRGEIDRAMADLSEAIRLDPNNSEAYGLRGSLYKINGDTERGTADMLMAQKLAAAFPKREHLLLLPSLRMPLNGRTPLENGVQTLTTPTSRDDKPNQVAKPVEEQEKK